MDSNVTTTSAVFMQTNMHKVISSLSACLCLDKISTERELKYTKLILQ